MNYKYLLKVYKSNNCTKFCETLAIFCIISTTAVHDFVVSFYGTQYDIMISVLLKCGSPTKYEIGILAYNLTKKSQIQGFW